MCVQVGSLSPLPYPALSVSHDLQFPTKHPFPEIWIVLSGSFSMLNLCSAYFLASAQSLEIYDCSRNTFPVQRQTLSFVCVPEEHNLPHSYFLCLIVKTGFFFKLWGSCVVVGRGLFWEVWEVLLFCEHKILDFLCQVTDSWTYGGNEKNRDERDGRGCSEWMVLPWMPCSPSSRCRDEMGGRGCSVWSCPEGLTAPLLNAPICSLLLLSTFLQPTFCP